jgi:hypothetical protein
MLDMRYFHGEVRFLDQAWDIYQDYYFSRAGFVEQYKKISTNERKNLFLMLASGYKLLVRDGEYHLLGAQQYYYVSYLDQTYKFISIMSLIEALFADEPYVDFYQWLTMKKRKKQIFPIANAENLDKLYREYKLLFGARKAVKFFSELDEGAQNFLAARIKIDNYHKPAEAVARKLYIMRSEFVHQGRLILEFNDGLMFSRREGNVMYSMLSLRDLQLLFEHGILHHFGMIPDNRKI